MPSLWTAGLYSAMSALLFCSAATSLRIPRDASSSHHRLSVRDERDIHAPALSDVLETLTCSPGGNGSTPADGDLMIAVASYIDPYADHDAWDRLIGYPNSKMPILIANVMNGPGSAAHANWRDVIDRASAAGKIVLGYVRTGYLGLSKQAITTRLGSRKLADWTAQIEEDVDSWYKFYGDSIGGIFFDEGWPDCGADNKYRDLYKYINDFAKRNHPGAYTILNPGSPIDSCFEDTMDTLSTFEVSYKTYTTSYTPNNWTPRDSRKLWHIVYDVPESAITKVAALARQRGAGFLQMTNDVLPNPYDNLPDDSYMKAQIAQASGGTLLNTPASSWPPGKAVGAVSTLTIGFSHRTSANLFWPEVQDALGYDIYLNSGLAASIPPTMTKVTIGDLQPGTSNAVYVRAIGGGGVEGPKSPTRVVKSQ